MKFAIQSKAIAERVFEKLVDRQNKLPREGFYIGQSVASVYQELVESDYITPFGKVTQYTFSQLNNPKEIYCENTLELFQTYYVEANKQYDLMIRQKFKERDNIIFTVFDWGGIGCATPEVTLKHLVEYQDLNCFQIGLAFSNEGEAILYLSEDYEHFLKGGQIHISSFQHLLNSLNEAKQIHQNIKGSFFNLNQYLKALTDPLFGSVVHSELECLFMLNAESSLEEITFNLKIKPSVIIKTSNKYNPIYTCTTSKKMLTKFLLQSLGVGYGYKKTKLKVAHKIMKEHYGLIGCLDYVLHNNLTAEYVSKLCIWFKKNTEFSEFFYNVKFMHYVYSIKNVRSKIGELELFFENFNGDDSDQLFQINSLEQKRYEKVLEALKSFQVNDYERFESLISNYFVEFESNSLIFLNSDSKEETKLATLLKLRKHFEVYSYKGYQLDFPVTKSEFERLGKQQNHCVGGYYFLAMSGSSIIFTLTKRQFSKTTVQLDLDRFGKFSVKQHFGKSNSKNYEFQRNQVADFLAIQISVIVFGAKSVMKSLVQEMRSRDDQFENDCFELPFEI